MQAIGLDASHLTHCMDHDDSLLCETHIYTVTDSIGASCWIIAGVLTGFALCTFTG